MTKSFIYTGDVCCFFRTRYRGGRVFDDYAQSMINMQNILESQMLNERKFKGSVRADCLFLLPFPHGMGEKRRDQIDGKYYTNGPTLAGMIKAVEDICAEFIFEPGTAIVAMNVEKRWSSSPRLEMVISEVK